MVADYAMPFFSPFIFRVFVFALLSFRISLFRVPVKHAQTDNPLVCNMPKHLSWSNSNISSSVQNQKAKCENVTMQQCKNTTKSNSFFVFSLFRILNAKKIKCEKTKQIICRSFNILSVIFSLFFTKTANMS